MQPTTLAQLARELEFEHALDAQIVGLTHDSRAVQPGFLYVAIPGLTHHGIEFLAEAVSRGAVAVASDAHGCEILAKENFPWLKLSSPRADMATIAAELYGNPQSKLRIIGVTGTNGKTTVTQMMQSLLSEHGSSVGTIGTLGAFIGEYKIPSARTTPESTDLFSILAEMVAKNVDTVCMEVSSHALELERVAGITFDLAIFTNLTQDHLDFHGTMEHYFWAKAKLFTGGKSKIAVIYRDDNWGRQLLNVTDAESIISVGQDGDWQITSAKTELAGSTTFTLHGPSGVYSIELPMYGLFNAVNASLCLAACANLGIDPDEVKVAFANLAQVPGRMQIVGQRNGALALVDYAHTPDAVEKVLSEIRNANPTRLITVLGCGGNRDSSKRAIMGQVSAELSDVLIITDDNPRFEDPAEIRSAIFEGTVGLPTQVIEIGDRRAAINHALSIAQTGDVIAVLGKGHELGQEANGVIAEFDDVAVILESLSDD